MHLRLIIIQLVVTLNDPRWHFLQRKGTDLADTSLKMN